MQRNNSKFDTNGINNASKLQIEMIRKAYPEYSEDTDWVIWIIPDFYFDQEFVHLSGEIKIKKKDGSVLDILGEVCTPYSNKQIYQLSSLQMDKRGRVLGVPLVFASFEEVMEILEVNIKWKLFEYNYNMEKVPLTLHYSTSEMNYEISFEKSSNDSDARLFIIHSKDYPSSTYIKECPDEWIELYMCKFDFAASSDATIELSHDKFKVIVDGSEYYKDSNVPKSNFSNTLQKYIGLIETLTEEEMQVIKDFADTVVCKEEVQYHPAYRKKKETIHAIKIADGLM